MNAGYCIGWDVGGWNCDRNAISRDAVVILDEALGIVGRPWRGNLRESLNTAASAREWICALFRLCGAPEPPEDGLFTLGIDTPLGFSEPFLRLASGLEMNGPIGESATNPYLYRQTERYLIQRGIQPLSAIKDMIGSQATKGMHALARFAPHRIATGIWSDGACLTAIEAYPAPCKGSPTILALRQGLPIFDHEDKNDALTCALLAHLLVTRPESLEGPSPGIPEREGWIWVPRDALSPPSYKLDAPQRLPEVFHPEGL
ncbi:MAG: hypothetical protein H6Q00_3320 [Holophagaceae bacterium]|nr:hypothetical protein [Holophagaceae bacterium]